MPHSSDFLHILRITALNKKSLWDEFCWSCSIYIIVVVLVPFVGTLRITPAKRPLKVIHT